MTTSKLLNRCHCNSQNSLMSHGSNPSHINAAVYVFGFFHPLYETNKNSGDIELTLRRTSIVNSFSQYFCVICRYDLKSPFRYQPLVRRSYQTQNPISDTKFSLSHVKSIYATYFVVIINRQLDKINQDHFWLVFPQSVNLSHSFRAS